MTIIPAFPAAAITTASAKKPTVLAARNLTKRYPGTVALDNFTFSLRSGEIRALLGKNGAGKSTFVEILSGTIQPDEGTIEVDHQTVDLSTPVRARAAGIATVHQEFSLFPELSVAENITIGRPVRFGIVSPVRQREHARRAIERLGVRIPLDARVGSLSSRDQQVVSIAKAIGHDPRVLILDEPTSALSSDEIEHLLQLVQRLARVGVAIVYVSHRLDEIPRVAESVTVLRDGIEVATLPIAEAPQARIVEMMLGRTLAAATVHQAGPPGATILSVEGLSSPGRVHDVSLQVRSGEVVGIWGIPGSGRTELLRAIYGLDPESVGRISIDGRDVSRRTPGKMIRRGVGLSPDDRKRNGVVLGLSVAENLTMACQGRVAPHGIVSPHRVDAVSREEIDRLDIKVASPQSLVRELSGGNQQKVVVGKWLAAGVRVLILDEPTKGIDVGAKAALYQLLRELSRSGVGVLLAPTELDEVFLACDRVIVIRRGHVVDERAVAEASPQELMAQAMGGS